MNTLNVSIDPTLSLFQAVDTWEVRRLRLRMLNANYKGSLVRISREIEEAVLTGSVSTRVFAGFQKFSYFLPMVPRYKRLARASQGVYVFGVPDASVPHIEGVIYVPLPEAHPLVKEWFLVVDAPQYFSALVALDITGFAAPDRERRFHGVWTFDDAMVNMLQERLTHALGLPPLADAYLARRDYPQHLDLIARSANHLVDDLEQRNAELRRVQALREDLTQMIVHDLRNPLTALTATLHLLTSGAAAQLPGGQTHWLNTALESSQRLARLINDILDFNKMEAGEFGLRREEFAIAPLITEALNQVQVIALQDEKTLASEVADAIPHAIADRDLIARVLANLLSNALKHTVPGTGHITVRARHDPAAQILSIAVQDNGSGIPTEFQTQIFDKFGQVDPASPKARQGTGLGLPFCQLAVQACGGTISVESTVGQGTTFRFSVPAVTP